MVDKRKNSAQKDNKRDTKRHKVSSKHELEDGEKCKDELDAKLALTSSILEEKEKSDDAKQHLTDTGATKRKRPLRESDEELERTTATAVKKPLLSSDQDDPDNAPEQKKNICCVGNEIEGNSESDPKASDPATKPEVKGSGKFATSQAVEHGKLKDSRHANKIDEAVKQLKEEDANLNADCCEKGEKDACINDITKNSTDKNDASLSSGSETKLKVLSSDDTIGTIQHFSGTSLAAPTEDIEKEPTTLSIGKQTKVDKPLGLLPDVSSNQGNKSFESSPDKTANSESKTPEPDRRKRTRKKHVVNAVQKQLEFYFSRANLAKDSFMRRQFDENSFVELTTISKFEKIQCITDDMILIRHAAKNSSILQLSCDETKVKSLLSTFPKEDEVECTIYVDGLTRNHTRDWVHDHFSQYGKVDYVGLPLFKDTKKSKGFAFVEFDSPDTAKKALMAYGAKSYDEDFGYNVQELSSARNFRVEHSNEQYPFKKFMMMPMMMPMPDSSSQDDWDDGCIMPYDMDRDNEHYANDSLNDPENMPMEEPEPENHLHYQMNSENSAVSDYIPQEFEHPNTFSSGWSSPNDEDEESSNSGLQSSPLVEMVTSPKKDSCDTSRTSTKTRPTTVDAQAAAQKKKKKKVHRRTRMKEKEKKRLLELKKKQKNHLQPVQLQVISKREWKFKRDKYLSDQKKTLAECKRIMRTDRVHCNPLNIEFEDQSARPTKQEPAKVSGTVVKVTLDKPLVEKKAMITGLKESGGSDVAFVDAVQGELVVFVRFKSPDSARTFASESVWKKRSSLLEGEQEDKYWDKVHAAWTARITGPKQKKRMRGKQKVTARWKKFQEKMDQHSSPASQENLDSD